PLRPAAAVRSPGPALLTHMPGALAAVGGRGSEQPGYALLARIAVDQQFSLDQLAQQTAARRSATTRPIVEPSEQLGGKAHHHFGHGSSVYTGIARGDCVHSGMDTLPKRVKLAPRHRSAFVAGDRFELSTSGL